MRVMGEELSPSEAMWFFVAIGVLFFAGQASHWAYKVRARRG